MSTNRTRDTDPPVDLDEYGAKVTLSQAVLVQSR